MVKQVRMPKLIYYKDCDLSIRLLLDSKGIHYSEHRLNNLADCAEILDAHGLVGKPPVWIESDG